MVRLLPSEPNFQWPNSKHLSKATRFIVKEAFEAFEVMLSFEEYNQYGKVIFSEKLLDSIATLWTS